LGRVRHSPLLDALLDPLDMSPPQALHLAAQFKVAPDPVIIQHAETVDDGDGPARPLHDLFRRQVAVGLVGHRQDQGLHPFEGLRQILFHLQPGQLLLVAEEAFPRKARGGKFVLGGEFPPLLDVGIVHPHLGPHLGELAHHDLAAAVAGVAHVLPVAGAGQQDLGAGDVAVHVAQGIPGELGDVQRAGVVDIDGGGGDLEHLLAVFKAEQVFVGPVTETAVLGEAVAANTGAGEDHVAVGRAHLDGVDHLDEIDAVALGKQAPLVQIGEDGGAVAVLHNLGRLAFDGPVEHGERKVDGIEHLVEELLHPDAGDVVAAGADPPEVADGGDVLLAGHHPLVGVGQNGRALDAAGGEGFLQHRPGDEFGGAGGDGGFDEHQAFGADVLADGLECGFQRRHVGGAGLHVAQFLLEEVALDIDHDAVGQIQHLAVVGGDKGLLLGDAAVDEPVHLRVLRLDRRDAAVEQGNFPVAAGAGPLAADDELAGTAVFVLGVGDDGGHHGADEAHAHDHHDLLALRARGLGQALDPVILGCVIGGSRQNEDFSVRGDGNFLIGLRHVQTLSIFNPVIALGHCPR